jgi:hypothetical protein
MPIPSHRPPPRSYPPVTGPYSRELQQMVKDCLEPNPERRPMMDLLLASPAVQARLNLLPREVLGQPPPTAASSMLDTIKVPKDLNMLKARLPPAQYQGDMAGEWAPWQQRAWVCCTQQALQSQQQALCPCGVHVGWTSTGCRQVEPLCGAEAVW